MNPFKPWSALIPEADTEKLLAASVYLAEAGPLPTGDLQDICYRLTIELARTRKALEDQFKVYDKENKRLYARWKFEHAICQDTIDENAELEERIELLELESNENFKAWETAQSRLENALSTIDELAAAIDWDGVFDV